MRSVSRLSRLLPHECFFGAFLVILWLRLLWAAGPFDGDSLLFSGSILSFGGTIAWCEAKESKMRWMVRLWLPVVVMNVVFLNMKSSVPKVMPWKFDGLLAAVDQACFGMLLSERSEAFATPMLTEILSFCYVLFFPYLFIAICHYTYRGVPLLRRLMVGLMTIYGLGFLGYSIVPAGGPHLAFPDVFDGPLTGFAVTRFNASIVAAGSNGVDVFPSLHCAVSFYLLMFDRLHARWRFWLHLVPCCGIWVATIYLRYHYAADLVAGFALAAFALRLPERWGGTSPNQSNQPS